MTQTSKYVEQSKPISGPAEPSATPGLRTNGQATLHSLHEALQAMRIGDFSIRLPGGGEGLEAKIADAFNEIVAANEVLARQLEAVGRDGNVDQRPNR